MKSSTQARPPFFERHAAKLGVALPVVTLAATLGLWEFYIYASGTPAYKLPAPSDIVKATISGWSILFSSLLVTLRIALLGLLSAVIGGVVIAILFTRSRWIEMCFSPYAVILQVTPLIAIAPLLNIYFGFEATIYLSAFIVGFFPVLSNTLTGLRSTDRGLVNLFALYGASPLEILFRLQLPSALPYFLSGVRIAGGLSLIGAIAAELVSGAAGEGTGLAFRITESGYRGNIPRMFAAVLLICLCGILIYAVTSLVSWLLLRRWHESALRQDA
ncbi:MAG: ABC transporter permease [Beijerinckiaceae bacterium]|nr:ABC transporter permease [Beijerinckiaceae bacterium]